MEQERVVQEGHSEATPRRRHLSPDLKTEQKPPARDAMLRTWAGGIPGGDINKQVQEKREDTGPEDLEVARVPGTRVM